jgi:hypothetical protein
MLNLADCEEQRGRIATAWQLYSDAATELDVSDERQAFAARQAASLSGRTPKLIVRVRLSSERNVHVTRENVELGPRMLGVPIPVDPGDHVLTLTVEGHRERRVDLSIAAGETRDVLLEPGAPLFNAHDAIPPKPTNTLQNVGFVTSGAGILGLVVGGVSGSLALVNGRIVANHCDGSGRCDQAGLDAAEQTKTFATVSTVSFVGAAVALTAGVAMIVLSNRRH